MGFSHDNSTHHFRLLTDGGAIEVTANSLKGTSTQDQTRMHLSHVAQMFTGGNFEIPMFIRDVVPPGVPVMKAKQAAIAYVFEPITGGGRVRISSNDPDALKAIHEFLIFQIEDHRTGDSETIPLQQVQPY